MTFGPAANAARGYFVVGVLSILLSACGGGGSDPAPTTPPPTELPQALQLNAPADHAALDAPVQFSSNAVDPSAKLSYRWQFGDGATSTAANPAHTYAKPGVYSVDLTITNEAGAQRMAAGVVSIADLQLVRGKVCNGANHAGWCWQKPLPQGNALIDYFFLADGRGWAVGEAGTVMATTDGGAHWHDQRSGTDVTLRKVAFINASIGWIAADNGLLLKTDDGGAHWKAVSWGQSAMAEVFGSEDANKAWVLSGSSNAVYTTSDGGSRWSRVQHPGQCLQRYAVLSTSDIWAVLCDGTTGLSHSTDGGANWRNVALPPMESGLYRSFGDLQFGDASHAWMTGYESGWSTSAQTWISRPLAIRTADGGATWQNFNPPPSDVGNLRFIDARHGYAWSWFGNRVLHSADGGMTWDAITPPALSFNYIVHFRAFTPQTMMIKDSAGRVHLSFDAGASWTERSAAGPAAAAINSVWFFDSREGMAISSDGGTHRSSDGGQTWTSTEPQTQQGWRRLQFLPDASVGWIIADSGTIYRSTDKGRTWFSPVPQNSASLAASDFHFVDADKGWAVTPYYWGSQAGIYKSVDGGGSWHAVEGTAGFSGLNSLRFADATHGVAVGPPGVAMVTSDAGVTWSPRPTGGDRPLRRLTFVDAQTAVAVGEGGSIVRSTDRGHTWSRVESGTFNGLNDVRFASAKLGWAVGESGTVLVTRDGGASWTLQPSASRSSLYGVFFIDEQTGWIVGDQGRILATATGGR